MQPAGSGIQPRFVDFHSHTSLKNYYSFIPRPEDANQRYMDALGLLNYRAGGYSNGKHSGIGDYDQATFTQLEQGNASIICTSLYAMEKQGVSTGKVPVIGWGNFNLVAPSLRWVNAKFVTKMSNERQVVVNEPGNSSFNELTAELRFLQHQCRLSEHSDHKPVRIAQTNADLNDPAYINLVLTVEGGHGFFGLSNSTLSEINKFAPGEAAKNEVVQNIRQLKRQYHIFFVTPAHLFWNQVAGHARGLDIILGGDLARTLFTKAMWKQQFSVVDGKEGEGILNGPYQKHYTQEEVNAIKDIDPAHCYCTEDLTSRTDFGWTVIETLLDKDHDFKDPTYIDMRHMDVKARIEYIDYVMKHNASHSKKIPLIVSHAGVSGKSQSFAKFFGLCPFNDDYREYKQGFDKQADFYRMPRHNFWTKPVTPIPYRLEDVDRLMETLGWFHPMSNNLFNEEIEAVFQTHGIIGLTFDERALGMDRPNYHSIADLDDQRFAAYRTFFSGDMDLETYDKLLIAEPFVRNMFYIVSHAAPKRQVTLAQWRIVSIGSDFDGIMNPIDICPTTSDIPAFFRFLNHYLPYYDKLINGRRSVLAGEDPEKLMRMVFYENGESFIKTWFQ
jgi:hypothetical protein